MTDFIHFSKSKDEFVLDSEYAVIENTTAYCIGDNPHCSSDRNPKMSERTQEERVIIASLDNHPMLSQRLNGDARNSEMFSHKIRIKDEARVFVRLLGETSITCKAKEARDVVERIHQENLSTSPSYANILIYIPVASLP
jgi:hypothetical protein